MIRASTCLLLLAALPALAEGSALLRGLKGGDSVEAKLVRETLETPERRDSYFRALGALTQSEATEVLRKLSAIPTPEARELLKQAGFQSERATRLAAIDVLPGALGTKSLEPLLKLSQVSDFEVAEGAIISLGYLKTKKAWPPLLSDLQRELGNRRDGASSPSKLGALTKALGTLLKDLNDPRLLGDLLDSIPGLERDYEREGAALLSVITQSKSTLGVPVLLAVINDPPTKHERNTILEFRWDQETSRVLERALGEDGSLLGLRPLPTEWKALAARGLGQARSPRAFQYLIKALKDRDAKLRLAALRALSPCMLKPRDEVSFERALDAVIPLLTDASRPVRTYAWRWLKRETKRDLPLSYPAWRQWYKKQQAKKKEAQ